MQKFKTEKHYECMNKDKGEVKIQTWISEREEEELKYK